MRDWPPVRPTVHHWDGEWARVDVPTEDGKVCAIEFRRCPIRMTWQLEIADELIRQSPQAVHAAVGQALMALGGHIDHPQP